MADVACWVAMDTLSQTALLAVKAFLPFSDLLYVVIQYRTLSYKQQYTKWIIVLF